MRRDPDPVQVIKAFMIERGLRERDLLPVFGTRSRVSEALNYKRPLSLNNIRVLHFNFGIDASALLRRY